MRFDYFAIDRNSSKKVTTGDGSSQLVDYYGWDGSTSVPFSNGSTAYAIWKRVSWKVTLSAGDGITNNGTQNIYSAYEAGGLYSDDQCTASVSSITPPTRSGYKFAGYNTASDGSGGVVVYANGEINDAYARQVLSHDVTLYAQWTPLYHISLDKNGGTGGKSHIYFDPIGNTFYSNQTASTAITSIAFESTSLPTLQNSLFLGYFTEQNGGDQKISADGTIAQDWAPSADTVLYAHWMTVVTATLDATGGHGGTPALSYDITTGEFFIVAGTPVTAVEPPTNECHVFKGYYTAASGGTQVIDGDGDILSALSAALSDGNATVYAQWDRISYMASLVGEGGAKVGAIYCDGENAAYYEDDQLTVPLASVAMPQRPGYSATGFFTAASGGVQTVAADGEIVCGVISADVEYYAQWQIKTYWLAYNANGGTVSPLGKSVTWQSEIGTLPTPTSPQNRIDATFEGWFLNGAKLSSSTIWDIDSDATAIARWQTSFSSVTDFFGYGSANLVPIESKSGEDMPRIVTRHYGKFLGRYNQQNGADAASSLVWLNPTVRYMVVGNVNFVIQLGKAWKGTAGHAFSQGVTGYMITSATIETRERSFPIITVSATANEGVNAINQFDIAVSVLPRARAQNLLGALNPGTGHLQSCTLQASCDPVVLAENMAPCASDVANGRIDVSGDVLSATGALSSLGAGSGFTLISNNKTSGGTAYNTYRIIAREEL